MGFSVQKPERNFILDNGNSFFAKFDFSSREKKRVVFHHKPKKYLDKNGKIMETINIQSTESKYVISIDKDAIDKDFLFDLLERLRIENLAQKISLDDSIIDFGEDIKKDWWQNNKERLLKADK